VFSDLRWKNENFAVTLQVENTMRIMAKTSLLILIIYFFSGCASGNKITRTPHARISHAHDIQPITGKQALTNALNTILQDSMLAATTTGIKVVRISDGEVLFQQNSNKLFHPASNMKLFTAAMALLHLGPEYRFATSVALDSAIVLADTLRGDIYLVGTGDPSFDSGDLADIVQSLHSKGIRYVSGNVICDDTYLDDMRYGQGWMWDDQPSTDASPIGALTINLNKIEIFVQPGDIGSPAKIRSMPQTKYIQILNESVTIDSAEFKRLSSDTLAAYAPFSLIRRWQEQNNIFDAKESIVAGGDERRIVMNIVAPARYFGTLFREACERAGIRMAGQVVHGAAPENAFPIAVHESKPVGILVANMNKPSNNLYAELFLKAAGAYVKGKPGTAQKGKEVLNETLVGWGIDANKIRFSDGSGVSRYGLLSPEVIISLLTNIYQNFSIRNEFIASLPIAGVDGTLANRMKGMAAERIVHAKTGTLSGVCTLSGYTTSRDSDVLAFSIMMSHFVGSARPFRDVQDRICDVLTRYLDR
ncbi:MAG: D-alanyl-D-alanine carboxypeptidase/D-alanyl-D-alanine-endopeptidase, partial [bacterium]